jgi:hypothetical protein
MVGAMPFDLLAIPSRSHREGVFMYRDRGSIAGKSPARGAKKSPAFHLTQREWRLRSKDAFRAHVGNRPCGAQVIAEEVECSPKTAQSWLAGETTPSGILDLRAMNAIPAYAALKREIAALEGGIDPRIQAKLYELYRMTVQLATGGTE